jgi:hypothetical protein
MGNTYYPVGYHLLFFPWDGDKQPIPAQEEKVGYNHNDWKRQGGLL